MGRPTKPTCSPLIVKPFARMLRAEGFAAAHLAMLAPIETSPRRIPVVRLQSLITELVHVTGDPTVGLRAALYSELGDFEVLEWVTMSAETWRVATATVCRYARVLNDAADYRFEVVGDRTHLMLGSTVPLHPAAADYRLAAYHYAVKRRVPEQSPGLEVWLKRPTPENLTPYRVIFGDAKLVFGAAFDGFVSEASLLEEPLPTANPSLHRVLRAHADHLLAEVASDDSLIERVNADILSTLRDGDASAEGTASRLGMARRTLTRQLADRGTSFSALLQEVRYRTAIHYLTHSLYSVEDIAFLLGFSDCPPFVRAFKRWSGYSPLKYRQLHAQGSGT